MLGATREPCQTEPDPINIQVRTLPCKAHVKEDRLPWACNPNPTTVMFLPSALRERLGHTSATLVVTSGAPPKGRATHDEHRTATSNHNAAPREPKRHDGIFTSGGPPFDWPKCARSVSEVCLPDVCLPKACPKCARSVPKCAGSVPEV